MLTLLPDNVKLIGLHGKAGSGKDFIASNCLSDYFKFAFANHFKIDIVRKYIFTHEEVFETKPDHVRHRLQQIGTEENRDVYGVDTWADAAEAWLHSINKANGLDKFVISDCRFDNEAEWVRRKGGIMIKIESNRGRSGMDDVAKAHVSEAGISDDLIDFYVINDEGTDVDSLKWQINSILELN